MKKMVIALLGGLLMMGFWGIALAQSKDEALSLFKKGQMASYQGRYEEALKYYEGALKINRALKVVEDLARNLSGIGRAYLFIGRYEEALKSYEEALEIYGQLKMPQEISITLAGIGTVYLYLGRGALALKYFQDGLKATGEQKVSIGRALNLRGLGLVSLYLGRYGEALKFQREALEISRELNAHYAVAYCLSSIGLAYMDLGRIEDALKFFEEGLKISRERKMLTITALLLNNIGSAYSGLGQYAEALQFYAEALKINEKQKNSYRVYLNLNNIGWVHLAQKDYRSAEGIFKKAEKERILTRNYRTTRSAGLIETYLRTQRYKEALARLNEVRPGSGPGSRIPPNLITYHTQKGLALKGLGLLKDASEDFLQAVSLTEEIREKVAEETENFFEARGRAKAYQGLVATLSERAIKGERRDSNFSSHGKDLLSAAFYFSESMKARAFLDAIARAEKGKQREAIPEKMREELESCQEELREIGANMGAALVKGKETYRWYETRKEWYASKFNNLLQELRKKYPQYALLYYPKPVLAEDLPLKDDEWLVEYSIGDDSSYVLVVKKGGVKKVIKIPMGREGLEEKVRSFMEPMQVGQYSAFSVKEAKELYEILLADALQDVQEHEKVIIITEGILGLLPFDALVVKEGAGVKDSGYVGDRFSLSYYPSAAVLFLNRSIQEERAERVLFALGNPIFSKEDPRYLAWKTGKKEQVRVADLGKYSFRALSADRGIQIIEKKSQKRELTYAPLPETETEVVEISKIMGVEPNPPDVLLSVMANETEFRKVRLDQYRYIHFATHADLPGRVQGIHEPFILLGQVENVGDDDGFLTLSEVLGLKLNSDMVVLSACLTGRGKVMEGEGVINFARAFQHAGADSVVVSLWEVASNETVEYMQSFYRNLKAGSGRSEGLKLARKEMKGKYPNPFFWAVFVLHGEG